jgi:ABC-type cobalamin/Fe3+-siderophores transport system ATPase subunit
MDEPIFALEDYQKERVMEFLCAYTRRNGLCLAYSTHELDLSQKYSDYLLLFPPGAHPQLGLTREMFTRERIENSYEVPFVMLRHKEELFRQRLIEADRARRGIVTHLAGLPTAAPRTADRFPSPHSADRGATALLSR